MKLLISEEIAIKEAKLLENASDKEKCFYHFLNGKPIEMSNSLNSHGEIDRVCLIAFCKSDYSGVNDIIERHRQMRVVKGVHFTSNLMNVCAFALCSENVKVRELNDYWLSHGLFEQFIISSIFPNYNLKNNNTPKTDIEELINNVFYKNEVENVTDLIAKLLGHCNDLTELFIIRKAFQKLCEIHPNLKSEKKYIEISNNLKTLIIKRQAFVTSIVIILLFTLVVILCIFFVKKWEAFNIEPILSALSFATLINEWIIKKLLNIKFEPEILNGFNNWLFKKIFPQLYKLKEILEN